MVASRIFRFGDRNVIVIGASGFVSEDFFEIVVSDITTSSFLMISGIEVSTGACVAEVDTSLGEGCKGLVVSVVSMTGIDFVRGAEIGAVTDFVAFASNGTPLRKLIRRD